MPSFPSLTPKKVEKILLKNSFIIKRQTGSHKIYYNPKSKSLVSVPFHSRDIPTGTLRSIMKQSNLPLEEFSN